MRVSFVIFACLCLFLVLQTGYADDLKVVRQNTCEPGTTFKRDCNTCNCKADGTVGWCTRRACNPPPTPVDVGEKTH